MENDNTVPLEAAPTTPDNAVSLAAPTVNPPLPDAVAVKRAQTIQASIGDKIQPKTIDEIKSEIQDGNENILRQMAASNLEAQRTQDKLTQLRTMASRSTEPLNETDFAKIMNPFDPVNIPNAPESVVEKAYGTQYIGSIQDAIDTTKSNLSDTDVSVAQDAYNKGTDLTARMAGYTKLREDAEAQVSGQSYPGFIADQLKNMFQPYVEYKMRGLDTGELSGGILLGTNLQSSADNVFALPLTESLKKAKEIGDGLAKNNPTLAVKWYQYLEGLPTTDRVLDNTFTAMLPFDYASLGKGIGSVAKSIDRSVRTNTAVRQLVQAADKVGVDPAARQEVTGDLGAAAETRSTGIVLQDMNGKRSPVDAVTEPLLTALNQDKDKIATSPGNLSTEGVRRIQDQYAASGKGFIQSILDSVRINRIPMALATQNAVKVLKDAVLDYYPGIRNAILDVSDPLYEPRSNTYWHDVSFGNFDGTLFSNEKTATNFAKLHGMDDVTVAQGQGFVTNAQTQKLLDTKIQLQKNLDGLDTTIQKHKVNMKDESLSEADRGEAKFQYEALSQHKKNFEAKLNETELRLKSDATFGRVSDLQKENESLSTANKAIKAQLKDKTKYFDGSELRNDLVGTQRQNDARLKSNQAELKAINEGNASVIGSQNTTVQQQGVGYKLVLRRPLVETDRAVRDLMIRDTNGKIIPDAVSTSSQTGWKSLMNAALWKLRGADDTLSINESINRKIGTYSQSLFKQWASEEAKYLRQISTGVIRNDPVSGDPIPYWKAKPVSIWNKVSGNNKAVYDRFVRTLEFARDARDPNGNLGYFFQTPGELNDHYLRYFNESPTFAEHQAYFAFTRMAEGDRMLREISEFRNRARLGVEQFQLSFRNANKFTETIQSPWFDGRSLKAFPGGDDVLMIMGRRQGEERLVNLGGAGLTPKQLEEYREGVKTGKYKVIELYAPEHTPLREFSDVARNEHVRYVLTDTAKSKPIEFNHVNRRGGGHFEYDYDHYLKQAKMYHQYEQGGVKGAYRSVYTGDTTFMPLLNRKMGQDIAGHLHNVQDFIRDGKLTEAKSYTEEHLPIEWEKLQGMFKSSVDDAGRHVPAMLDLNEKFIVVPKGRSVLDMDKNLADKYGSSFKNAATSGSLNRQFNVAYNTERESEGVKHFMDVGTAGNPIYKYSPTTKFIDPITTMNKALNRIVQSTYMDDYKIFAVEHWLREAEEHLEPVRAKLARSSPNWVFTSATDKSAFRAGTPWETVRNLMSNRYKIMQFTGIPSTFDTAIHSAKQMLIDWSYAKFGPEEGRSLFQKALSIAPNWMLSHVNDPVTWLRSMTFHEKLGLFNPAQWLVQAQTYATILGISPVHGTAGTYAAMLHAWSRINRSTEIVRTLDDYATKLSVFGQSRWRPGEFKEAMEAYERTGFGTVAGEHSYLDTALKTDFVGSDFKSFLHAGTWFFRQGERSMRDGAWYTAFREFREANPTKTLTQADIAKILQRADLLTVNMSRASSSVLQQGIFSLPSQFLTYQVRMAELFLGNRLGATTKERMLARARLVTFYSLLYGAPSAIGVTGLPFTDAIRSEATQRGYTVGDNWISTAVDQGLPAIGLAMITGGGDFHRGNNYNIGARLGSPGFTQFNDALKSDHPWWQLLGGASGSTMLQLLQAGMSPFWRVMSSQLQQDNSQKSYPLMLDDLIDVAKNVSSVNQGWKLYKAIETGKWMSKNEAYIGDVTKANAAFMATFGFSPQQQDDAYLKGNISKSYEEMQKADMKNAVKELRRGYQAQKDQDPTTAQSYFKRADAIMTTSGLSIELRASTYAQSLRGMEGLVKDEDYRFATNKVPNTRNDIFGIPTPFTTQSNIQQTRINQLQRAGAVRKQKEQ